MDYEKKYKEALENARQEYNTTENVERKQWLEELFPELAESEDEKIRKVLVELVKCNERCGYFMINNITTSAMLAWLEKKGESKLAGCEDDRIRKWLVGTIKQIPDSSIEWETISKSDVLDWLEKQNLAKFNDEKDEKIRKELLESFKYQQRESRTDKEWLNGIKLSEVVAWLEKQGEQRSKLVDFDYNAKDSDLQEVTYFIPNGFHAEIDGNKVVIKQGEQKPAWSEEDEKIALSIEHVMNCASLLNIVPEKVDKIRTWIKSLKQRMEGKV